MIRADHALSGDVSFPNEEGLYFIFLREIDHLARLLGHSDVSLAKIPRCGDYRLAYIGSTDHLARRIMIHLNKSVDASTFRFSLASLFASDQRRQHPDMSGSYAQQQARLTSWLSQNALVALAVQPNAPGFEALAIRRFPSLLNISGQARTRHTSRILRLRDAYRVAHLSVPKRHNSISS